MDYIDLRSDTVSWPTPEMRDAMANAQVGDDVYNDDPTVNQLQADAATMLGKEAGLFVASGTMGNITAALTHCGRGDEMIVGREAHMFVHEAGASSGLSGIHPHIIDVQPDGTLPLDAIRRAVRRDDSHFPRTRLICLENTQGAKGGIPVPADYIRQVGEVAREHNLKLHIDGARIFNAATALHTPVHELVAPADSISFCLSKGLCAPVGSLLVGSCDFIQQAYRIRKSLGGGMRQVGVLAAAGLIALHKMSQRLHEDHATACLLAEGLAQNPYIKLDVSRVQTNLILLELAESAPLSSSELSARLKADHNILIAAYPGSRRIRLVTHYWITPEKVEQVLDAVSKILA